MHMKKQIFVRAAASAAVLILLSPLLAGAAVAVQPDVSRNGSGASADAAAGPVRAESPRLSAKSAVLLDAYTGRVLYASHAEDKSLIASTTKIMTALVVLETLDRLSLGPDSRIIVPAEAAGLEGSSVYLKAGEEISMEELLYGMMLQSGNDAATAAAICAGGSLQNFVVQMNQKAEALGCTGTHFTNACGLFDENHYTTAKDMARIAAAAMQREDFRRIASAPRWQSAESERNFYNKNKTVHQYEGGDGVKIGFTKASGRTLVASATRNEVPLIAVVLRDGNWFADAYAMLDYGFAVSEGDGR